MRSVRQAYSDLSDRYIELFGSVDAVNADDLGFIARHLTIRPGRVLDAGCGPGHLTAHLCSLGVDAFGIDVVPEFVEHARASHPDGHYEVASMLDSGLADHSVAGILAWYSLIHVAPDALDETIAEFRRVIEPGGTVVIGIFVGDEVEPFDHRVATAYRWPLDVFADRLTRSGFTTAERIDRPGVDRSGQRPHGLIAAVAT